MTQNDKDRFMTMAECYDAVASYLVPKYDFLQDEMIALLFADGRGDRLVVDLGAGSGILLEKILSRFPSSRGVWVDASDGFRAVAATRLAAFGGRVRFVRSRLEEPWERTVGEQPDAICSMSAIHHLASEQKQRLYARCHDMLVPGGWLFNIDEMSTMYEDAYLQTLRYWVRHVDRERVAVPEHLVDHAEAWCERFDNWKHRNIENRGQPKVEGDDIHEGYVEQMRWLRDAGFVDVDLFVKFQLWSVIGGRKA